MIIVEAGTFIRYISPRGWRSELKDLTEGKIYVVEGKDERGDIYFIDDADERNYTANFDGNGIFEIVN